MIVIHDLGGLMAGATTFGVDRYPRPRRSTVLVALPVVLVLFAARAGYGQDAQTSQVFTRVGFTPAYVVSTNPFASTDTPLDEHPRSAPSLTVEIGRQTDGSRDWHHLYGLPSYGVGVSIASPGSGVSRPVDAYTFFSWPFAHLSDRVHVATDFGMGISWNWKELNQRTRSYRPVLGSNLNARIDWGLYLRYLATRQTSLYAGVDFTHRSNGGTRQPDLGINVIGPSVGLRHDLAPASRAVAIKDPPPFRPAWGVFVGGVGGLKNVAADGNPDVRRSFGTFEATTGVQRHFYRYGQITAGTDLIYNGAAGARVGLVDAVGVRRVNPGDRLALGLYGGYEHVIGRFAALLHTGCTVANGFGDPAPPRLYQRYGWRYRFSDDIWGLFAVRAIRGRKADFLEFGLGYNWRRPDRVESAR